MKSLEPSVPASPGWEVKPNKNPWIQFGPLKFRTGQGRKTVHTKETVHATNLEMASLMAKEDVHKTGSIVFRFMLLTREKFLFHYHRKEPKAL